MPRNAENSVFYRFVARNPLLASLFKTKMPKCGQNGAEQQDRTIRPPAGGRWREAPEGSPTALLATCHCEPVTDVTGVAIRSPPVGATLAVARPTRPYLSSFHFQLSSLWFPSPGPCPSHPGPGPGNKKGSKKSKNNPGKQDGKGLLSSPAPSA